MQTGENEQGLRKVIDLTRGISILFLLLHFYWYCSSAFELWDLTFRISVRLMENIARTGLFNHAYHAKLIALGFLLISLLGVKGRKDEKLTYKTGLLFTVFGLAIYFLSYFSLYLELAVSPLAIAYMGITLIGYLLVLTGGNFLSRVIQLKLKNDD